MLAGALTNRRGAELTYPLPAWTQGLDEATIVAIAIVLGRQLRDLGFASRGAVGVAGGLALGLGGRRGWVWCVCHLAESDRRCFIVVVGVVCCVDGREWT